jgi:hypothetical protein
MGIFSWLQNRLPSRKIIEWEDTAGPTPVGRPRDVLEVITKVKRMTPLAQVRKCWGRQKLMLQFSKYIANNHVSRMKHQQAIQVCLHELMHIALWDDISIVHSTDPKSLLYSMVDGNTHIPTEWDLSVMTEAASRINEIHIYTENIELHEVCGALEFAVAKWNQWVDKELFKIL